MTKDFAPESAVIGLRFFPLKSADVRGAGTRDEPLRTSAWEAMSTWPQRASGARGSGVRCRRGAGGWVGYRSVRKTSLLIECFVTPATKGVYRKTFAETMFLLNPKDVISFSR